VPHKLANIDHLMETKLVLRMLSELPTIFLISKGDVDLRWVCLRLGATYHCEYVLLPALRDEALLCAILPFWTSPIATVVG